ncbi:hypothetical protein PY093_20240 [Cytobacillus sp. S13-E01]|uniref:hypothetical protein n=1 Tax=Cytobacillus sp. S13-E01 TaxID=3031326 RepID=UPI0023D830B1|nr:hypothetical protein [Cytobacillus sp. S13-E01]MDF0728946.1 hypothetical protein [Cytobacillus sp. S13-E01]
MSDLLKKKLISTFVSTAFISILMSALLVHGQEYGLGAAFAGWTLMYGMYVGAVILIYGNLVSLGVEYLQHKWFKNNTWVFIALHVFFGLIGGFVLEFSFFTVFGVMAALFYACIDRWIFRRKKENKGILWFVLTPVLLFGLLSGYFQLISSPLPPFTQDDAVEFATSGEGTFIDLFPKKVGIWEGTVDSFQVVRKTSVKEIGYETYMVTFTETWSNEQSQGQWYMSYKVERGTLSASLAGGKKPPYHE